MLGSAVDVWIKFNMQFFFVQWAVMKFKVILQRLISTVNFLQEKTVRKVVNYWEERSSHKTVKLPCFVAEQGGKKKDVTDISIIWVIFLSSGHKQGKSLCPGIAFISSTAGIVMAVPPGDRSTLRRPTFKSSALWLQPWPLAGGIPQARFKRAPLGPPLCLSHLLSTYCSTSTHAHSSAYLYDNPKGGQRVNGSTLGKCWLAVCICEERRAGDIRIKCDRGHAWEMEFHLECSVACWSTRQW